MADFSSCSLDELIEVMTTWPVGVPVRAMERALALGDAAIPPLSDTLRRWQTEDSRDLLWPIVVLGELGNPRAIEPLADQVRRAQEEELGLAAAEALVKVGAASLPALRQLAADTDPITRIYGYAALGWLRNDEAFSILLDALSRDPELADVVAQALGDQGRKETIPVLYDAYQNARRGNESNSKTCCATSTSVRLNHSCGRKTGKRDTGGSRIGVVLSSDGRASQ